MVIDFHTHVFPKEIIENRGRYIGRDDWFAECYTSLKSKAVDASAIVASMDRAGIDQSVICGFCWKDQGLCSFHNDYIIEAVRAYRGRLIGFATVDPTGGETAISELQRCLSAGLRGVGEINADAQQFSLTDFQRLDPFVQALMHFDVPLLLHCSEPVGHLYPGKGHAFPELLYQFILRYPALKLVCAHWGGGLPFYELMPEVASAAANVYYDTAASSLLYRWEIVRVVSETVGPGKVLFGTDFPLVRQDRYVRVLREMGLKPEVLDDILGGNAERLLHER